MDVGLVQRSAAAGLQTRPAEGSTGGCVKSGVEQVLSVSQQQRNQHLGGVEKPSSKLDATLTRWESTGCIALCQAARGNSSQG